MGCWCADEPAAQQKGDEEQAAGEEGGAAPPQLAGGVDRDWDDEEWDAAAEDTLAVREERRGRIWGREGGGHGSHELCSPRRGQWRQQ